MTRFTDKRSLFRLKSCGALAIIYKAETAKRDSRISREMLRLERMDALSPPAAKFSRGFDFNVGLGHRDLARWRRAACFCDAAVRPERAGLLCLTSCHQSHRNAIRLAESRFCLICMAHGAEHCPSFRSQKAEVMLTRRSLRAANGARIIKPALAEINRCCRARMPTVFAAMMRLLHLTVSAFDAWGRATFHISA